MQTNQIIALLLSFVFVLMFVMIFVTMRLVNIFAHKIADAESNLRADRTVDGDDGVTAITEPATTIA
ncbi:hypothetical protein SBOR_6078 [Sclerotinia borealis F-4128]|uniref:Uncharacterized protein n=1 Tax=Sclerotinia borealis (strain F-4128) TaxID=1432307 RepID=W9CCE7_SCLBF|nr:hypothetical protein SBOR_6078 [Sclerotinia borealis F-4128]